MLSTCDPLLLLLNFTAMNFLNIHSSIESTTYKHDAQIFNAKHKHIYMLLWTLLERRLIKKKMLCLFFTRKACGRRRLRAYIYCWSLVPPLHQLSVCVSGKCPFYTPGRRVDRVRSGTPGDSRYAIVSAIQLPSCQINIPLKLIMASSTALVYTAILFL